MKTEEFIKTKITDILKKLGEEQKVEVYYNEEQEIYLVDIEGEDVGHLIGFHGEIIYALQNILFVICKKQLKDSVNIYLDIGDYRKKREDKVRSIANEAAKKALNTGRPQRLNSMSPSDRRVVHTEITNYTNLVSYSVGEGQNRRVVVEKSEI